jgi:hypothetical protein
MKYLNAVMTKKPTLEMQKRCYKHLSHVLLTADSFKLIALIDSFKLIA